MHLCWRLAVEWPNIQLPSRQLRMQLVILPKSCQQWSPAILNYTLSYPFCFTCNFSNYYVSPTIAASANILRLKKTCSFVVKQTNKIPKDMYLCIGMVLGQNKLLAKFEIKVVLELALAMANKVVFQYFTFFSLLQRQTMWLSLVLQSNSRQLTSLKIHICLIG